ncbi:unnamed protein product, partial [Bubo scandiacus]
LVWWLGVYTGVVKAARLGDTGQVLSLCLRLPSPQPASAPKDSVCLQMLYVPAPQNAVACTRLFLATFEPWFVPRTGAFGRQVQLSIRFTFSFCTGKA